MDPWAIPTAMRFFSMEHPALGKPAIASPIFHESIANVSYTSFAPQTVRKHKHTHTHVHTYLYSRNKEGIMRCFFPTALSLLFPSPHFYALIWCNVPVIVGLHVLHLTLSPSHPQLTGLIHDIGKIMHLWGEPQWATVGDTFVVGCAPDPVRSLPTVTQVGVVVFVVGFWISVVEHFTTIRWTYG